jgi:hypothetical protein
MSDLVIEHVASMQKLDKPALLQIWKELFKTPPPIKLRRQLMIPMLAYRLQEQAFGSLRPNTRGRLRQSARALEAKANANAANPAVPTLKPGTRLVRQWRDQVHLVNVENNAYEYQGIRYQSLSQIARQITGTRWSGPAFFGLKKGQKTQEKETH